MHGKKKNSYRREERRVEIRKKYGRYRGDKRKKLVPLLLLVVVNKEASQCAATNMTDSILFGVPLGSKSINGDAHLVGDLTVTLPHHLASCL